MIEEQEPRTVFVGDTDADASEVKLLRELGFDSVLMVAIEAEDGVGVSSRSTTRTDVASATRTCDSAQALAAEAGQRLRQLERPA